MGWEGVARLLPRRVAGLRSPPERILHIDATHEPHDYSGCIPVILVRVETL